MSTFSIFLVLITIVCFLLIVVIMVQNPKGGGLSSTISGTQMLGGVQKTTDFLDKSTWTLATILIALILLSSLSFTGSLSDTDSKIIDKSEVPQRRADTLVQTARGIPERPPLPGRSPLAPPLAATRSRSPGSPIPPRATNASIRCPAKFEPTVSRGSSRASPDGASGGSDTICASFAPSVGSRYVLPRMTEPNGLDQF